MAEKPPTTPRPDTIVAIATPFGRGGIGVVRVSGTNLSGLARDIGCKITSPRIATLSAFRDAEGGVIDTGLLLYFPAPHSFTGEDVIELQGHGGPIVLQMLLRRCLDLGARLAEPGEFTRRAYLNGKLDLAQAEAVVDLIDASTAAAARNAIRSLQGEFSREIKGFIDQLIELRALVEAALDFPEEEVEFLQTTNVLGRLNGIQTRLATVFDRANQGKILQNGLHIVIVGQPNVGKSSLLNQLAGDDLAIVTPVAGTTRDVVRGSLQIEGVPLHIIDTAGLRETEDEVEKIGILRTWREIEHADVVILLVDARNGFDETDKGIMARLPSRLPCLTVHNKIDLAAGKPSRWDGVDGLNILLSAKHGDGIDLLRQELLRIAGWHPAEDVFVARERHLLALIDAQDYLAAARERLPQLELFAEELRRTQVALSTITGEFTADDLLGEIFGRFCIGK